ncbi:MAG: 3-hydroxyacyl-CoA dehydrogenase [Betaproteobacteria bacterium]
MTQTPPQALPPRTDVVGVVGAGLMGRGITQIAAQAGFEVRLIDARPGAASDARRAIADVLEGLASKGRIQADDARRAVARIALPDTLDGLAGCTIVVEAIVEKLDAKQALFRELEAVVGERCILATNTSSLPVTAIASVCARPDRVAGLHFFSPVPLMKLVEVIAGLLTAPAVEQQLVDFGAALGHTPVCARDTPGFIVNHAGRGYGTEALRIVSEGIADHATIDRILKRAAGFRMGPFELFDLTGLDVSHPVMESIYRQYYEEPRFRPSPITAQRLSAGLLGRKSGRGFYDYGETGAGAAAPPAAYAAEGTSNGKPAGTPAATAAPAAHVWLGPAEASTRDALATLLSALGVRVDGGAKPAPDALCVVLPLGRDATSEALAHGLDARRTVALDSLFGFDRQRTLMTTPVTDAATRDAARSLFAADGVPVETIRDSPGFVAQRVIAHIVNVACEIAQQRIAAPADIDLAVRLGLAYPMGPLAWGDALGPLRILGILQALYETYGDPRYRPSVWLSRRARLGVSLLTPDA